MTNEPAKHKWWIAAVCVPLLAALIGALTPVIYDQLKSSEGAEETDEEGPDEAGPAGPGPEDLRYAERLTEDWMRSITAGDLRFILSITETPFFFDQVILRTEREVEEHYSSWWEDEGVVGQTMPPATYRSWSVSQFKREFPRGAFYDRILGSGVTIMDTDIVVVADIEGEGAVFYYRKVSDQLKLVGFWG